MINFFRHIRQRLLSKSKFSKYLIYAIGEIILVVIGILIALQINNWNEDRNDRAKEQQLLQSFKTDLIATRTELERVMHKSDETACLADSLLMYKRGELTDIGSEQLDFLILDVSGFTVYQTHEGTVQDILGSGILDIIKNDSIRLSIGSWQANLKGIREYERLDRESSVAYMEYLKAHVDIYNVKRDGGLRGHNNDLAVFDDRVFMNNVAARKRMPTILNFLYQDELPKLNRLISTVNAELE